MALFRLHAATVGVWGTAAALVELMVFTVDVRIVVEFLFLSNVGLRTPVVPLLLRWGGTGGDIGVGSSIGLVYCGERGEDCF